MLYVFVNNKAQYVLHKVYNYFLTVDFATLKNATVVNVAPTLSKIATNN